ncbi:MAG TPA: hypothetical protein VFO65_11290 [Acidimicrobiales bacterium]|nr:hypothetical protein [Acidimicrobiales bacterium]
MEQQWRLTCACGWQTEGVRERVYEDTLDHGRRLHNMEVTPEQVDQMSTPLPEAGT